MPSLGADMEAGTLVQWLKQPGDALARGDIIAVVDTEKGAIEIEVFEDGVLDRALVTTGEKVPVGTVLALIRDAGEPASQAPLPAAAPQAMRASPAARKAADELKVALTSVTGTGAGGAITREDVERAASRGRTVAPPRPPEGISPATASVDKQPGMRSAIAAAMSRSKREIPHVYLSTTIDMTAATTWLATENEKRSVEQRLLPIALLLKAVAKALGEVKGVNGFWVEDTFKAAEGIHVGCAIALRDGLVAPAIHDTDRKDLDTIMRELIDLTARARRGTLRSSELSDATITVTNLGELGVEEAFAVIYPPQVAIVTLGKVTPRPWVVDGKVEPRTMLTATISADHRAVDGRRAGQFLAAIDKHLQMPGQL